MFVSRFDVTSGLSLVEALFVRQATLAKGTTFGLASLSTPTLMLCVAGVLLPNALSVGALLAGIGSPPRTAAIFAYAALALGARIAKPSIVVALYLAIAAYDTVSTVALLFNLAPSEVGLALNLSAELKLFHSPLYIALILGLAGLVIANIAFLILKRDILRRGNPAVMAVLALVFGATDLLANTSPHYQFGTLYGANKPMESAGEESGFRRTLLTARPRNALMVMVEAMGHFADPAKQAILLQPFRDANLLKRYDVKIGTTTYYGSTTHAEMRELCNTRQTYLEVMKDDSIVCLPELVDQRGYQTVSLHNFTSAFFGRHDWYPKLGFEKRIFGQDVIDDMQRLCGGPFRGPCDVDLIPMIGKQLRQAKQPTFFYWMTLSTHVPIAPGEGTPRLDCKNQGGAIGHVEVCYMTEMWIDLFEGVARVAADIAPMEILIVGDHAPPLWSKAGRELFTPGKVTWIRLTPRSFRTSRAR
jgi:hypothetical protein